MKLYGVLVAQNEGDVIVDTLRHLKSFDIYEEIYFYDLKSKDDTYEKALKISETYPKLRPAKLDNVYNQKLRFDLLKKHSSGCIDGDWLAIVDADEFYVENPLDFISTAEEEDATCINTYQAQFYFTDEDLRHLDSENISLPIYNRRKYYLIDWSEPRFYKFFPNKKSWISTSKACSKRLLNRHYQYRSPDQMRNRIQTRIETREKGKHISNGSKFNQVFSTNWRDYIVPHKNLHKYEGGHYIFGIPEIACWKDFFNRKGYTSTLHPQLAEAFRKEKEQSRNNSISRNTLSKKRRSPEDTYLILGPGNLTLTDRYGELVYKEFITHFTYSNYAAGFHGLFILCLFYYQLCKKKLKRKFSYMGIFIKDKIWNMSNTLERKVTGKSTGSIHAVPNPAKTSDYFTMSVGNTSLVCKWSKAEKVEVHLDSPNGKTLKKTPKNRKVFNQKKLGNNSILYLQDVSDGLALNLKNTISRVTVQVYQSNEIKI